MSDKKLFCFVSECLHLRTEMKESYSDHIGGGERVQHRSWNCAEVRMVDLENDCLLSHWNQLAR